MWITPAGVDKGTLKPADIICVHPDGSIVGPHKPSSEYRSTGDLRQTTDFRPSSTRTRPRWWRSHRAANSPTRHHHPGACRLWTGRLRRLPAARSKELAGHRRTFGRAMTPCCGKSRRRRRWR
jgi:hypothetical protein